MNKPVPTGRIDSCLIVEVIEVTFIRGTGVDEDPIRRVQQWYHRDGTMIAEIDSAYPKETVNG